MKTLFHFGWSAALVAAAAARVFARCRLCPEGRRGQGPRRAQRPLLVVTIVGSPDFGGP